MMFRRPAVAVACLAATALLSSGQAAAQKLGPALLPANTEFVLHVDVARLGALIGIETILDSVGRENRELREAMRRMKSRWDFDPTRDIESVTLFGDEVGEEPRIMIVTNDKLDDVLDALDDVDALEIDKKGPARQIRVSMSGVGVSLGFVDEEDIDERSDEGSATLVVLPLDGRRRAVLVGERPRDVAKAARVFAGEAKSLADREGRGLRFRPEEGVLAYAEIGSIGDLLDSSPASEIGERIERIVLQAREDEDEEELELAVVAETGSKKDASNVAAVVNGLRALLSLAGGGLDDVPEEARLLVQRARARADGAKVSVRLALPMEDLREMIDEEIGGRKRSAERARNAERDAEEDREARRERRREERRRRRERRDGDKDGDNHEARDGDI